MEAAMYFTPRQRAKDEKYSLLITAGCFAAAWCVVYARVLPLTRLGISRREHGFAICVLRKNPFNPLMHRRVGSMVDGHFRLILQLDSARQWILALFRECPPPHPDYEIALLPHRNLFPNISHFVSSSPFLHTPIFGFGPSDLDKLAGTQVKHTPPLIIWFLCVVTWLAKLRKSLLNLNSLNLGIWCLRTTTAAPSGAMEATINVKFFQVCGWFDMRIGYHCWRKEFSVTRLKIAYHILSFYYYIDGSDQETLWP